MDNHGYVGVVYPELGGYRGLRHAVSVKAPYRAHIIGGDLGIPVLLAAPEALRIKHRRILGTRRRAAFTDSIPPIIRLRTKKQMGGVAAGRIVAGMADEQIV
jgi:hypothetical protein